MYKLDCPPWFLFRCAFTDYCRFSLKDLSIKIMRPFDCKITTIILDLMKAQLDYILKDF